MNKMKRGSEAAQCNNDERWWWHQWRKL